MQKELIIGVCLLLTTWASQGQKQSASSNRIDFHSYNTIGLLEGESNTSWQIQSVNGVQFKNWFAGAGLGLDYYFNRSIPVFLDLRASLFRKPATPFIYADAGYNYLWAKDKEKEAFEVESSGGTYYDLGIGYQLPVLKGQHLVMSAGYSHKELSRTVNTMPWSSVWPMPPQAIQKYEYSLKRISIKAGLRF